MTTILRHLASESSMWRITYKDLTLSRSIPQLLVISSRNINYNRHVNPKYRTERARKVWKVNLPDFDYYRKEDKNLTPDQIRTNFKEKGIVPPTPWNEREVFSPSTIGVIEAYVPQGDGKSSLLDKVKLPVTASADIIKNKRAVSVIKSFEGDDFDIDSFAAQTTDIYVKAHECLANKDNDRIFDYVTEHCFPVMVAGQNRHTITWKYLGDIELPQVEQVRVADLVDKGNKYAQITVRLHTKQILAVYDRHGRLVLGSPNDVKEVLEYVVFEKYLANEYGSWRIHDRIRPQNSTREVGQVVSKTFRVAA